jgi:hypothetical protein
MLLSSKLVPSKEVVKASICMGANIKDLTQGADEFDNCWYVPAVTNKPLGIVLFAIVDSGPLWS